MFLLGLMRDFPWRSKFFPLFEYNVNKISVSLLNQGRHTLEAWSVLAQSGGLVPYHGRRGSPEPQSVNQAAATPQRYSEEVLRRNALFNVL